MNQFSQVVSVCLVNFQAIIAHITDVLNYRTVIGDLVILERFINHNTQCSPCLMQNLLLTVECLFV